MKNIAIPITKQKENTRRQAEIVRLKRLETIPAMQKQDRETALAARESEIVDQWNAYKDEYSKNSKALRGAGLSAQEIDARQNQLNEKFLNEEESTNERLRDIYREAEELAQIQTDEWKAACLSELKTLCDEFEASYGLQPLNDEEMKERSRIANDHKKYVKANKYRDDRTAEYPAVGDQLDMMWKALEAIRENFPPEVAVMLDSIQAVKAKHPKPGKGDDEQKDFGA